MHRYPPVTVFVLFEGNLDFGHFLALLLLQPLRLVIMYVGSRNGGVLVLLLGGVAG
jgi:hypothetical protein